MVILYREQEECSLGDAVELLTAQKRVGVEREVADPLISEQAETDPVERLGQVKQR